METSNRFEADTIEPDITKILETTLRDNGGFTTTLLLRTDSLAMDAAVDTDCPDKG